MKITSINICFFYLFGVAVASQNTGSVMTVDETFVEDGSMDLDETGFEKVEVLDEVDVQETLEVNSKEYPTKRYMRGRINVEDKNGGRKQDLVAAEGGNSVPVAKKHNVDTKRKIPIYGDYGGHGYDDYYYDSYGYYDSYSYSGYGGYGSYYDSYGYYDSYYYDDYYYY
jgi:hypothetical protein|eukprot:19639_1